MFLGLYSRAAKDINVQLHHTQEIQYCNIKGHLGACPPRESGGRRYPGHLDDNARWILWNPTSLGRSDEARRDDWFTTCRDGEYDAASEEMANPELEVLRGFRSLESQSLQRGSLLRRGNKKRMGWCFATNPTPPLICRDGHSTPTTRAPATDDTIWRIVVKVIFDLFL